MAERVAVPMCSVIDLRVVTTPGDDAEYKVRTLLEEWSERIAVRDDVERSVIVHRGHVPAVKVKNGSIDLVTDL